MSLPKGLPSTLKLGAVNMTIAPLETSEDIRGQFDHRAAEIGIDFARHGAPVTLLHETMHAIWYEAGLGGKEKREERVVSALSAGLAAAMRDNPAVFDWIASTLSK